jgi:hypothetical protein
MKQFGKGQPVSPMRRFYIYLYTEHAILPWKLGFTARDLDHAVEMARADIPALMEFLAQEAINPEKCGLYIGSGAGVAARTMFLPDGTYRSNIYPSDNANRADATWKPPLRRRRDEPSRR